MKGILRPLPFIVVSGVLATLVPWRAEPTSVASRAFAAEIRPFECAPPHPSKRTFVGFREQAKWNGEVEPAARAANSILAAVREQACSLEADSASDAALQNALRTGDVEITEVSFRRNDFHSADVHLRIHGSSTGWSMRVQRGASGAFEVASVRRQSHAQPR